VSGWDGSATERVRPGAKLEDVVSQPQAPLREKFDPSLGDEPPNTETSSSMDAATAHAENWPRRRKRDRPGGSPAFRPR
jgi:hypothetical protein